MMKKEQRIIKILSTESASPRTQFRDDLRKEVVSLDEDNNNELKGVNMNFKRLAFVASFAFVAVVGVVAMMNLDKDSNGQLAVKEGQDFSTAESDAQDVSMSTSLALPTTQLESVEEARQAVSFDLYLPSEEIGNEDIVLIEKIDDFSGGGLDSIAIKYGDSDGTLYRVNQSLFIGSVDESAENLEITFLGNKVTATYTRLADADDPNSEAALGDFVSTSYLSWENDGIGYEISEFGELSRDQLISLAESMK